MSELEAHGIKLSLPKGIEGRVFRRPEPSAGAVASPSARAFALAPAAPAPTVVHCSTQPLPSDLGDFGSALVPDLGPDDVFVVLFEYPGATAEPLFAREGVPRSVQANDFDPNMLQRAIAGQAGVQAFAQEAGRAFCLYAVIGSFARRATLVDKVNAVLADLVIEPLPADDSGTASGAPTLGETVESDAELSVFWRLVDAADLRDVLDATGPLTVFAPLNGAFAAVDVDALIADPAALLSTVAVHVVQALVPVSALVVGTPLTSSMGRTLAVESTPTGVTVGSASIVRGDIEASNGILHVVDRIMVPEAEPTTTSIPVPGPSTTTTSAAPRSGSGG